MGQTEAVAVLDTSVLLIGDQTILELTFSCPADYTVKWPLILDTITSEIEVLKHTSLESTDSRDGSTKLYRQSFTITAFDSGYFAIPPFVIGYQTPGDTTLKFSETEALLLQVNTVPVDMQADFKDIKDPMRAPFTFREALPYILVFLGALLAGFLIYYYLRKRKKAEPLFSAPAPRKIPADQLALESLETLRFKKLWQSGEIKQYHTELTDIVREYLWGTFGIHAHEYTTEEIMHAVNGTHANNQAKEKLHQTLMLADMVKFAKLQPLPLEHDASLNNAIDFVKETRHLGGEPEGKDGEEGAGAVAAAVAGETSEGKVDESLNKRGKEVTDVE